MRKFNRFLSALLSVVLTAAVALSMAGCEKKDDTSSASASSEAVVEEVSEEAESSEEVSEVESSEESSEAETSDTAVSEKEVLGEGKTVFDFTVVDTEGVEKAFEIHTDKKTVGEALVELDLIAGDDSEYGLYVKKVNGVELDWDKDGKYWAFYINDEYASTGVDATDVEDGAVYSFRAE